MLHRRQSVRSDRPEHRDAGSQIPHRVARQIAPIDCPVVAGSAVNGVRASGEKERVVPPVADKQVVAGIAPDGVVPGSTPGVLDHHTLCDRESAENAVRPRGEAAHVRIAIDERGGAQVDRDVAPAIVGDLVRPAGIPDALPRRAGGIRVRDDVGVRAGAIAVVRAIEKLHRRDIEGHRCRRVAIIVRARRKSRGIIVGHHAVEILVVAERTEAR